MLTNCITLYRTIMDADALVEDAVVADPPPVMDVILEWI